MEKGKEYLFYFVNDGTQEGWTRDPWGVKGKVWGGTNNLAELVRRFPEARAHLQELREWAEARLGTAEAVVPDWRGKLDEGAAQDTMRGTKCQKILNALQEADSMMAEYGSTSKFGKGLAIDALQRTLDSLEGSGLDADEQRAFRDYIGQRAGELGGKGGNGVAVDGVFRGL